MKFFYTLNAPRENCFNFAHRRLNVSIIAESIKKLLSISLHSLSEHGHFIFGRNEKIIKTNSIWMRTNVGKCEKETKKKLSDEQHENLLTSAWTRNFLISFFYFSFER